MQAPTTPHASPPTATGGISLNIGGHLVATNFGGVFIIEWPGAKQLQNDVQDLCSLLRPVVRYAGGALVEDLPLWTNAVIESAIMFGTQPDWLPSALQNLFAQTDCPVDFQLWNDQDSEDAAVREQLQARVARALAATPDILLVDADDWPDEVLRPEQFTQAYTRSYPQCPLVWASARQERAHWLRESLQEVMP
jgi:hypothetical protein